jgi:hypothetical protein
MDLQDITLSETGQAQKVNLRKTGWEGLPPGWGGGVEGEVVEGGGSKGTQVG